MRGIKYVNTRDAREMFVCSFQHVAVLKLFDVRIYEVVRGARGGVGSLALSETRGKVLLRKNVRTKRSPTTF